MRLSEGTARRRRIVGHLVSLPQRSGIRRMNPRRMSVDLIPWSQGHLFARQATPKDRVWRGDRDKIAFQGRKDSGSWPPCILAVMVPALQSKCTQRTQRELKVKTTLLDLLAESKGTEAADVLAQRVKALEKSARDNKQWRWAKHLDLELVEGDDTTLVDQGEDDGEGGRARGESEAWSWADCEPWKKG